MKRYERDIEKVKWYQTESGLEPVMCPKHDLLAMVPAHQYGDVYLYCPHCSYQIKPVPDFIYKAHYEKVFLPSQK
jgi:hypothetical protein